jgi:hypothetical protein
MMHGWGMGGLGMGFLLVGLAAVTVLGVVVYVVARRRKGLGGPAQRTGIDRVDNNVEAIEPGSPTIFRLARRHGGTLTVSDVVTELGVDPQHAETLLDGLTDGQRVDMDVDTDGIVRYVFREFRS